MSSPERLRIPIRNISFLPWEMQEKELREMGIDPGPAPSFLWRWETDEERFFRKLEGSIVPTSEPAPPSPSHKESRDDE